MCFFVSKSFPRIKNTPSKKQIALLKPFSTKLLFRSRYLSFSPFTGRHDPSKRRRKWPLKIVLDRPRRQTAAADAGIAALFTEGTSSSSSSSPTSSNGTIPTPSSATTPDGQIVPDATTGTTPTQQPALLRDPVHRFDPTSGPGPHSKLVRPLDALQNLARALGHDRVQVVGVVVRRGTVGRLGVGAPRSGTPTVQMVTIQVMMAAKVVLG